MKSLLDLCLTSCNPKEISKFISIVDDHTQSFLLQKLDGNQLSILLECRIPVELKEKITSFLYFLSGITLSLFSLTENYGKYPTFVSYLFKRNYRGKFVAMFNYDRIEVERSYQILDINQGQIKIRNVLQGRKNWLRENPFNDQEGWWTDIQNEVNGWYLINPVYISAVPHPSEYVHLIQPFPDSKILLNFKAPDFDFLPQSIIRQEKSKYNRRYMSGRTIECYSMCQ